MLDVSQIGILVAKVYIHCWHRIILGQEKSYKDIIKLVFIFDAIFVRLKPIKSESLCENRDSNKR